MTGYARKGGKEVYARIIAGRGSKLLRKKTRRALKPIHLPAEMKFTALHDNALLLSTWKMTMGDAVEYGSPGYDDRAWLNVTGGAWETQLGEERDNATYPVTLWYRTRFEADYVPSNLRLLVDGFSGKGHTLFVNGTEVRDTGRRSRLDAEIKEIDIASMVRPGVNSVAIRLEVVRRTDGILDPLKLIGAFALDPVPSGYRIVAPKETLRIRVTGRNRAIRSTRAPGRTRPGWCCPKGTPGAKSFLKPIVERTCLRSASMISPARQRHGTLIAWISRTCCGKEKIRLNCGSPTR